MELDENKLFKSGLNPTSFVALVAIYKENKDIIQYLKNHLKIFEKVIDILEREGYVKITGPDKSKDFVIRKKTLSLLGQKIDVSDWYEEWRNLFPSGTNSGGYYYRGNRQEVFNKLQKFVEKNQDYSKEEIFNATKKYINRCKQRGAFMLLAHFFIEKKGVGSTLLTELENLDSADNHEVRNITVI